MSETTPCPACGVAGCPGWQGEDRLVQLQVRGHEGWHLHLVRAQEPKGAHTFEWSTTALCGCIQNPSPAAEIKVKKPAYITEVCEPGREWWVAHRDAG